MEDQKFNEIAGLLDEGCYWNIDAALDSVRALLKMVPVGEYGLERQLKDVEHYLYRASQEIQGIEAYDFEADGDSDDE